MQESILEAVKKRQEEFKTNIEYGPWHSLRLDMPQGALCRISWPRQLSLADDRMTCCHRTMTLKQCRNVLEADLGLKPGDLDSHKEYVRDLIEKVSLSASHPMLCK